MIKNITATYLIGLSVTSLALVLFIVLPYGNSVIAQQQHSTNSSEHNNSTGNNKTVTISQTPDRQQQQNPHSMSMKGPSPLDFQLNLSDNVILINQSISICLFVCQPDLEYNIPRLGK